MKQFRKFFFIAINFIYLRIPLFCSKLDVFTPITGNLITSSFQTQSAPSRLNLSFSSNGHFLAVPNFDTSSVTVYRINKITGILTPVNGTVEDSSFPTQNSPSAVAYSPDNRFAIVSNRDSNTMSVYSVNQTSGILSPITGNIDTSSFPTLIFPNVVAYSPNGLFVAVVCSVSDKITVYNSNQNTGAITPITGNLFTSSFTANGGPAAIVYSPDGKFAAVCNLNLSISIYRVLENGALALVNNFSTPGVAEYLAYSPDGRYLSVVNSNIDIVSVYSADQTTGMLTPVQNIATQLSPVALNYSPNGKFLAVVNNDDDTVTVFSVNRSTGKLSYVTGNILTSSTSTLSGPTFIAYTPDQKFAVVPNFRMGFVTMYNTNNSAEMVMNLPSTPANVIADNKITYSVVGTNKRAEDAQNVELIYNISPIINSGENTEAVKTRSPLSEAIINKYFSFVLSGK